MSRSDACMGRAAHEQGRSSVEWAGKFREYRCRFVARAALKKRLFVPICTASQERMITGACGREGRALPPERRRCAQWLPGSSPQLSFRSFFAP